MRARLLLCGALATSALLAGCAQGTGDSETDVSYDPDATLQGKLQVMGFDTVDEIATVRYEEAKKALGDKVDVKLIKGAFEIQQFLPTVASGNPPSLIYAERSEIGTLASRGALIPMDDCIEGEEIDTSVFRKPALAQVTFDDTIYGVPEFNVVQILQANSTLLDEAGLSLDDVNGSDWEAISQAAEEMSVEEGGDLTVIGYDSKLPEFLPLWAKANGVDLISADGRTANLDDPKVIEALEFAVGVYDVQGGFGRVKAFRDSADFFGSGNQFATGTLGAMPMEQWYVNVLNEVSPDAPMAFDTMRDVNGEPIAFASGQAWAIPKGSPNPAAACRFARTMTETSSWVKAAEERVRLREKDGGLFTGVLTGNVEADEKIRAMIDADPSSKWGSAIAAMYEANEHTFSLPANPADNQFETAWQDAVNRVLNGEQEPADALREAQQEAQAALDEAWANWEK
jgi:multiple sugar transport system substrate-binding protein